MSPSSSINLEDFHKSLARLHFIDGSLAAKDHLYSLKMNVDDLSVDSIMNHIMDFKFEVLCTQNQVSDSIIARAFVSTLRPKLLSGEVAAQDPKTFKKAIQLTLASVPDIRKILSRQKASKPEESERKREKDSDKKKTSKDSTFGRNPSTKKKTTVDLSKITCFNCNETGHYSNMCPKKTSATATHKPTTGAPGRPVVLS